MTFTTLLDGGLSVKIGGVERRAVVNGLEFETTNNGDGSASFWVEVADPFNPQAQYPELVHGAPVLIDHTLAGTTTSLYAGFVLTDPRAGYAGEKAIVAVECGGPLEVAKNRTDMGFIFTDADLSQWFANKRSPRAYGFDNTGRIAITTGDNVKVPYDRAGMIGAVAYLGATHLVKSAGGPLSGYRRITGTASWDLRDHLDAALLWWPSYRVALDASNYHVVKGWAANGKGSNKSFDYAFGGSDGAGYVALAMWSNKRGGTKTTDERFIELEDVVLYTDVAQKTVDQAMLAVADVLGLHSGADTETIGSVIKSLVARPYADPESALAAIAVQADKLVEWGYFGGRFRARPLLTDPVAIRALGNCYRLDAEDGDVHWDVTQHPEEGVARSVRLIYGHTGKTRWPAGSPAQVIAPSSPGWESGVPFMGATSPVMTVDFSGRNYTEARAKQIAAVLASWLGMGAASGTVAIKSPTVPVYGGGARPAPYVKGADWVECRQQAGAGPLYVTRSHVSVDTGYVDLEVGLSLELLIDQLQAAGSTSAVSAAQALPEEAAVSDEPTPIPGLSPEASLVVDIVAERAARRVVDEFKENGCPFPCRDMTDVRETLYGREGLKVRLVRIEGETADLVWYKRAVIAALIAQFIQFFIR